jgi:hypothetical protein
MNWRFAFAVVVSVLSSSSASFADAKFTYMLPRTVLDTTIVYAFDSCADTPTGAQLKIKITPTIVSRSIPDLHVGPKTIDPADLGAWSQDRSISLKTFAGSHILNSIGSQPTSQIGQIIGNVLGGVTKLVAVGLGVVAADVPATPPPPKSKCGAAKNIADSISKAQKQIRTLQDTLATNPPPDETTQKRDQAEIQALQTQITSLQADQTRTTITIKKTIDPGFTPIKISENKPDATAPFGIDKTGLIATFDLGKAQVEDAKWYDNFDNVSNDDKALLEVNMYLDFPKSYPSVVALGANAQYHQTNAAGAAGGMFREAEYVPVLFWRGKRQIPPAADDIAKPLQLSPSPTVVLAQYGVAQSLPTTAKPFESLNWSITFNDNGEVTDASFSTKAWGVGLTGAFGSVASAANSAATEVRSAASAASSETIRLTAENNALTQQVNNITLNQTLQGLSAKGLAPQ